MKKSLEHESERYTEMRVGHFVLRFPCTTRSSGYGLVKRAVSDLDWSPGAVGITSGMGPEIRLGSQGAASSMLFCFD